MLNSLPDAQQRRVARSRKVRMRRMVVDGVRAAARAAEELAARPLLLALSPRSTAAVPTRTVLLYMALVECHPHPLVNLWVDADLIIICT